MVEAFALSCVCAFFLLPFATIAVHSAGYSDTNTSKSSESATNRIALLLSPLPLLVFFSLPRFVLRILSRLLRCHSILADLVIECCAFR
jgi:hypothetical protein